jgi:hypothetical protein
MAGIRDTKQLRAKRVRKTISIENEGARAFSKNIAEYAVITVIESWPYLCESTSAFWFYISKNTATCQYVDGVKILGDDSQ